MNQWETIVANFDAMMSAAIPGIEANEWRSVESYVSLALAPEPIFHRGFAVLLQSIPASGGEVNSIHTTTYTVRLQLAMVMSDKEKYDEAMGEVEAIIRQRMRVTTYQGVFRRLEFLGAATQPIESDQQWFQLMNCDFNVTLQGT